MKWKKMNEPISDEVMTDIESKVGVKLPRDFMEWYQEYEGPDADICVDDIKGERHDAGDLLPPNYIIQETQEFFDEDEEYSKYGVVIPFAVSSINDKFCFFYPKGNENPSGIFFASRDLPIYELFDESGVKSVFFISNTFQEFLDKLYVYDPWAE
ncbi:SMI1 / KNR4 family (SUKH-1) [Marininema mesophilum]|uniref:SMI1 / KNR4 family (SUKH-1) n=1 Tax=Marininema mesophilum TaxID=1048340 RepID=A0A1H2YK24_9BACL|nr:SMI1/KNR4 family protein [Marininema mesophilum]SDX04899.1 SMI1 / KNR4 family (SUKH-1) [Marininema mesophilum]